jgi:hypothetical protein
LVANSGIELCSTSAFVGVSLWSILSPIILPIG